MLLYHFFFFIFIIIFIIILFFLLRITSWHKNRIISRIHSYSITRTRRRSKSKSCRIGRRMTAAFALMCLLSTTANYSRKISLHLPCIIFRLHLCLCYWQNVLQPFVVVENKGLLTPDSWISSCFADYCSQSFFKYTQGMTWGSNNEQCQSYSW